MATGKMEIQNYPTVLLGRWVKERRKNIKVVASKFADDVGLTPAQYAEFELGIGSWLTEKMGRKLYFALRLNHEEGVELKSYIDDALDAKPLSFAQIFNRDQLKPLRLRESDDSQLTLEDSEQILDQVFAPLS